VAAPTYVIELTPPGRAAVAVVLVAGTNALPLVAKCFAPLSGQPISNMPLRRIAVGRWGQLNGEEVVVCRRSDHEIEIHCHGGVAAVRAVMNRLIERGGQQISWQQWLRQSSADPLACAARFAMADAPTTRTAAVLLDQFHGALTTRLRAALEAAATNDWEAAQNTIERILQFRDVGLHLTKPWRVVLTGAPNVGKSSLLNSMAGFQRAVVSPLPGTTRDVVTLNTAIDGWPVQLADTAGIRAGKDELESAGVALAQTALTDAELVVAVHDATMGFHSILRQGNRKAGADRAMQQKRVIHVLNKIDLLASAGQAGDYPLGVILTSALTGEGIAQLLASIGRVLVPVAPAPGAAVPFTPDQVASLDLARTAINQRDAAAVRTVLMSVIA